MNNKLSILFGLSLMLLTSCSSGYTIKGKLAGNELDGQQVMIINLATDEAVDSGLVESNSFLIKGTVEEPAVCAALIGNKFSYFVLENARIALDMEKSFNASATPLGKSFEAFALLTVNPCYLTDVGFQLSFMAVASILLLMPGAEYYLGMITERSASVAKKSIKAKIVGIYRETLLLSLVAQLGTAPLSIYYFNQFPQYFLLGNVLLVPLATLLFYLCFAFIVLSPLPWLSEVLVWPVNALASFFCRSSAYIENMRGSLVTDLWPSKQDVLICYLLLALLFYLFKNKRYICALNKLISKLYKQISD
jgi:ComEC/Rec2-related protein